MTRLLTRSTALKAPFAPLAALALVLACFVCLSPGAVAQPQPNLIPQRWEFKFEPGDLRYGNFTLPNGQTRPFYYFTYKVTNNSGTDLLFAPKIELATDLGDLVLAGQGVPLEIAQQAAQRMGNDLLLDQIEVLGILGQGDFNAREGVVFWPAEAFRTRPSEMAIYARGFSGETRRIIIPSDPPTEVVLHKTYMLRYQVPGTLVPNDGSLPLREERWILR